MDFQPSPHAADIIARVKQFIATEIAPIETAYWDAIHHQNNGGDWTRWTIPPQMEALKAKAKSQGLWNLFLPEHPAGAGLTTLDYAAVAEETGHSFMAPEVFNCNAPDSGNMEVLVKYGSPAQQERWLAPLLAGTIRSVFCMTEPAVASSDATNMQATATIDGDEVIVHGRKWWSSGIGDPRAKIAIVLARTANPEKDKHSQHSMVLVPLDTPGVKILRMLPVFGEYDEPHGHGEVDFDQVRVPASNIISAPGRGFAIAQGRLGPGRIHHCMRCIGAAEEALKLAVLRGNSRTAFGQKLIDLGGNRERIAELRIAIDQARLLTLYAAWKLDKVGAMAAMTEISAIKVVAPTVLQETVDFAIQIHGGCGVSLDTPLTRFYNQARSLRLADGPDEVHKQVIAKIEVARHVARSA